MTNSTDMQDRSLLGAGEYDPRYLQGVLFFNRGEYFEAHEIWEDLWRDCASADRRFYQSLIQAAVALYHDGNGNRVGAARLYESGRRYMEPYRPHYRGLAVERFWLQISEALTQLRPEATATVATVPAPRIVLDPAPPVWPDHDTEAHHE